MNILPQNTKEFLNKKYWDKFFGKLKEQGGKDEFFEWYGNYKDFDYILQKLLNTNEYMLNIGCGKSLFSEDMYDEGYTNILNIDYSEQVIEDMKARSQNLRPSLKYEVMDIFNMSYKDQQFQNILDKGCLDAVYPDDKPETREQVLKLFNEIIRVSTKRYVAVSLLQEHIIQTVLDFFGQQKGYNISIYEVLIKGSKLYPFLLDIQFNKSEDSKIALYLKKNQGKPIYVDIEQCKKEVKNIQLQNHFMGTIKKLRAGQRYTIDLWDTENKISPKFTLNIVDSQSKKSLESKTCGCFIVPQGRESGYLFASEKGNFDLLEQTNMSRLIVAILNPGFVFDSLKQVQAELSPALLDVIPKGCSNIPVPFMTDGDEIGEKGIVVQNDEFVVEEIVIDDEVYRRLILKSNYNQVQSQFKLTYIASNNPQKQYLKNQDNFKLMAEKKNMYIGIDDSYLDFEAHRAIVAGLSLFTSQNFHTSEFKVLILGGGLCGLGKFLQTHFFHMDVTTVEISQSIIDIAKEHFEVFESEKFQIVQADAHAYIEKKVKNQEKNKKKKAALKKKKNSTDEQNLEENQQETQNKEGEQQENQEDQQEEENKNQQENQQVGNEFGQDYIIIDINGKMGQVSPPEQFLEIEFLKKLQKQLKPNSGVLAINVIAFNDNQKQDIIAKLSTVFDIIYTLNTESDVNDIYFCVNHNFKREIQQNKEEIILVEPLYIPDRKQQEKNFKNHMKTRTKFWDQTLNIEESLGTMKMICPKIHGNTYERNNYHVIGDNEGQTYNKTKEQYMKDLSCINKSQQKKKQKRSKK